MNFFYLDRCPERAARAQCDKHVVKMGTEVAQVLSAAAKRLNPHFVAPCSPVPAERQAPELVAWCWLSRDRWLWALMYGVATLDEYSRRYGREHASMRHMVALAAVEPPKRRGFTDPPQRLPIELKVPGDAVEAYRSYYVRDKAHFAVWTPPGQAPEWFNDNEN